MRKLSILLIILISLSLINCMKKESPPTVSKPGGSDLCSKKSLPAVIKKATCDTGETYKPPTTPIVFSKQSYWDFWNQIKGALKTDGTPIGYFDFYVNGVHWQSYDLIPFYGTSYHISEAQALRTAFVNEYNTSGNPNALQYLTEIETALEIFYKGAYNCDMTLSADLLLFIHSVPLNPANNQNFSIWIANFGAEMIKVNMLFDKNSSQAKLDYSSKSNTMYSTTNNGSFGVFWVEKIGEVGESSEFRFGQIQDAIIYSASGIESRQVNGYIYPERIAE